MPLGNSILISADSHYTEPGDIFINRVPSKFKDVVPRMERMEKGDAWVYEGFKEPINFGLNVCAGNEPENMKPWVNFDEIRAGGYDPKARLEEQDRDGISGEVMYPTPRLSVAMYATEDVDLHLSIVRAYNDWQSEFCEHAPNRFCGLVMMPNRGGPKATIEEMERVLGRPGMRGVTMGCYPNGTTTIKPEDDMVWEYLEDKGIPVNIHVALSVGRPGEHKVKLPGWGRFFDVPTRMIEMIFSGVFDRFPNLEIMFAEVDFGWLPYVKEQIDNNYQRLEPTNKFGLKKMPSDYIDRHIHLGYMTDSFGVRNMDLVNPERVLWGSDYPHISADYPFSWRTIQSSTIGLNQKVKDLITYKNAARMYGFEI